MGALGNHWISVFICGKGVTMGDEQMSPGDSHFTYSSSMLPSLGARSNHSMLADFLFHLMILVTGMWRFRLYSSIRARIQS